MIVLGVGLPKSGTCTLHRAFTEAGLRSAHQKHRGRWIGHLLYAAPCYLADLDCVLQPDVCQPHRGLNLWPQLDYPLLARLSDHGVTLLLHTRHIDALISSITRWRGLRERLVASDIPGLPAGAGAGDDELGGWIEAHYRACRALGAAEVAIESPDAPRQLSDIVGRPIPWWGVENANQVTT